MTMREMIFRGKALYDGRWVHGSLVNADDCIIIPQNAKRCGGAEFNIGYIVDHETVGQYTGLKDRNGVRIFEGDIVRFGDAITGTVNYNDCCFCVRYIMKCHTNRNNPAMDIIENEYPNEIEVIGNIHDNPELLQEGA